MRCRAGTGCGSICGSVAVSDYNPTSMDKRLVFLRCRGGAEVATDGGT